MIKVLKFTVIFLLLSAFATVCNVWHGVFFVGRYYNSADLFMTSLMLVLPFAAAIGTGYAIKYIWKSL